MFKVPVKCQTVVFLQQLLVQGDRKQQQLTVTDIWLVGEAKRAAV